LNQHESVFVFSLLIKTYKQFKRVIMADKNKKVFEGKSVVDSALHGFCIKTKKPGFIDAICEVCEKVYETDQDTYICPECREKLKNK